MDFNGHNVRDVKQGVEAVISHHVSPVIGYIRLADADGRAWDSATLENAYKTAAEIILATLADTQADAWDEGFADGVQRALEDQWDGVVNPYRKEA